MIPKASKLRSLRLSSDRFRSWQFCHGSLCCFAYRTCLDCTAKGLTWGHSVRSSGQARLDASDLPDGVREEARGLLSSGRKIEAVKVVRDGTGWGLKGSKEAVEGLQYEVDAG